MATLLLTLGLRRAMGRRMHGEETYQEQNVTERSAATSATLPSFRDLPPLWRPISNLHERIEEFVGAHPKLVRVGLAVGLVLLFAAYVRLSLMSPKNSDDASYVLQAQDILQGNLLLHGWVNPPDSFFTTFLPLYVLGGFLTAHMAVLMYVVPAITYVLLVAFCGALTWTRTEPQYRFVSTLLVLMVVAALPSVGTLLSVFPDVGPPLQSGGDHKTTILLVLITFYLLSTGKKLWLASIPLTLATVGDPLAAWVGIPAVGLVGLLLLRRGQARLGGRLLLSAGASVLIAKLFIAVIPMVGGFDTTPGNLRNTFVSLDDLPHNVRLLVECIMALFGASPFGLEVVAFHTAIVLIHLTLLILLIWVIWRMARTAPRQPDMLKLLLLSALILNVCAFIFSTTPTDLGSARYLPTPTIFGPLLAGLCWYDVGIPAKPLWIATPIIAAAFLIPFGLQMLSPIQEPRDRVGLAPAHPREVIEFLEANHLTEGYGSYWSAGIFTVLSDGKIKVRQVSSGPDGRLVPLEWVSARQWYEQKSASFLIFKDNSFGVNSASAVRTWGVPVDRTEIDGYIVFRWPTPINLAQGAVAPH